ncbi:unnamed protein product [Rotaria sp. Silwood1]|nr:unnamed protein product [Rotaria sp. Silwood1]
MIVPSVFIQCLSCHRWYSPLYCQSEGFISYLNDCVHMFMLMMISVIRCVTVFQTNIQNQFIGKHSYRIVIFSWLFGLIFPLSPLFNWNKYTSEGIGLYCGLDWFDQSLSSCI